MVASVYCWGAERPPVIQTFAKLVAKATDEFDVVKFQQFGYEGVWFCHFPIRHIMQQVITPVMSSVVEPLR